MANDTVKIKFDTENSDIVNAELKEKKRLLDQIDASAGRLRTTISALNRDQLNNESNAVIRSIATELKRVAEEAIHAQLNVQKLNVELAKSKNAFNPNFSVGSRGLLTDSTRGGGGAGGSQDLVARFSNAKKEVDGLATSTKKLGGEMTRVHGIAEIGASLFAQVGVRGGESISLLIRQFSEMGLTFDKLLQNRAFLLIVGVAGAAGIAMVTEKIKEASIALLKFTQAQANIGLLGSSAKQRGDVENLKEILDTIDQMERRFGNADAKGIIGRALGKPDLTWLEELQQRFSNTNLDRPQLLNTRQDVAGAIERAEFDAAKAESAKFLNRDGATKNIFTDAKQSLIELAREVHAQPELNALIDKFVGRGEAGTLKKGQFDFAVEALKQDLQERQRQLGLRQAAQESEERLRATAFDQTRGANKQIQSLSGGIDANPFAKLFVDAQNRMEQFRQQFPLVTKDVFEQFKTVSDQVMNLELFKTNLSEKMGLRNLEGDIARLQASGAFSNRDISESENARLAQARVKQAQFFGSLDDVRSAQAGLLGRGAELEAQARQAHFSGQFVREAELQNQADQFNRTERNRLTEQDIKQREILALKGELGGTNDPNKQRFVLDKLLEVTSNIGELSGDDRELRLKSLQQRLALGEARQKVLIEIKNSSDSATVTQDSLGPEPSPNFGNGVLGAFGAALDSSSSGVAFGASDPNNRVGN